MAKRKVLADPVRARLMEQIDALMEHARESIQHASDLAEMLNATDESGEEKIEIDGNVITGVLFKK